jgi:hypothetical protein
MTVANITYDQGWFTGADKQLEFALDDTAANPTTWDIIFVLKRVVSDTTIVFQKATGGDGVTTEALSPGPGYKVVVDVSSADTLGQLQGWYSYALRRVDAGNNDVLQEGMAYLRRAAA